MKDQHKDLKREHQKGSLESLNEARFRMCSANEYPSEDVLTNSIYLSVIKEIQILCHTLESLRTS